MNIITKRTIALAISAAALATAVTPSFAQTRVHRLAPAQMQEPYGPRTVQMDPYAEYQIPGYTHANQCVSDEGNGRVSSCTDSGN